jgi:hypothetical protein
MTSHGGRYLPRRALLDGFTSATLLLVHGALWFFRLVLGIIFASCVSALLLACGATPAYTQGPWVQTMPNGTHVFRVCRRHPRVDPVAPYWYDEGDGTPRTAFEPLAELLESRSVEAVFIHDPYAPPESRKLLGSKFDKLPCDKPPPPPPPPPPPAKKIEAEGPTPAPAERAEKSGEEAHTTVRTVTRRSVTRPSDRPRSRPPDQRFIGQTAPTPAPTPGQKVPDPPPPPGRTYSEQKANAARMDAEAEARRTGERIGRAWGETLGKADEARDTLDGIMGGGFDELLRRNPKLAEELQTGLAQKLNAIPDLPEYDDERLGNIAWEAFLKGYGKGLDDAKLKFGILNTLATGMLLVAPGAAIALETAGAKALRAALQRLKDIPIFLPTAAGGPGAFLRRAKMPAAAPATTQPPVARPATTQPTTTTATAAPGAIHGHHPWPKYLGGPAKQDLANLSEPLHKSYHSGLDRILPRQRGTAYYDNLSPQAKQQLIRDLAAYTKAFDAKYGTRLYDSMVRNGFPDP